MKTIKTFISLGALFCAVHFFAAEPAANSTAKEAKDVKAGSAQPAATEPAPAPFKPANGQPASETSSATIPALPENRDGSNTLRMNFRAASLDLVLNYL